MIKESLTRIADRSFRWIAAVLMRRAIAPLIHLDETFLSDAGLSRAAIAAFMASPLNTDPCRFFARRRAQDRPRQITADMNLPGHFSTKQDSDRSPTDDRIGLRGCQMRASGIGRDALRVAIAQMTRLRMGALTATAVTAIAGLSACSGSWPDRDTATTRRDQAPGSCRLRPDSLPRSVPGATPGATLASIAIPEVVSGRPSTASDQQRLDIQPDARDGPPPLA